MATGTSPWIVDVTEETFEDLVLRQSLEKPVVVDFWSPSCGPCRTLGPMLEKLTREHQGQVLLAKVNVDDAQALAMHFQIERIPFVVAFKEGQPFLQFEGALPESTLRDFFNRLLPAPVDPDLVRAQALEEPKPAEAEKLYRKLLAKDSASETVRVGLARVLAAQKKPDEVNALLEPIDSDGPNAEEAQRIRSLLSLQGLSASVSGDEAALRSKVAAEPNNVQAYYELGCLLAQKGKHEEALEMLLSAGERDPGLAAGKVREAMVQVFYALGPSHPTSDKYRSKLARLLY
jgi:putative thioredoxin